MKLWVTGILIRRTGCTLSHDLRVRKMEKVEVLIREVVGQLLNK